MKITVNEGEVKERVIDVFSSRAKKNTMEQRGQRAFPYTAKESPRTPRSLWQSTIKISSPPMTALA